MAPLLWYFHGMTTTIDSAGRLVVPKALRERAGLKPGIPIRIEEKDGRIEIEAEYEEPKIVQRGKFLVAVADPRLKPPTSEEVSKLIEEMREERFRDIVGTLPE